MMKYFAALVLLGGLAASEAEAHSIYIFAYQDEARICTNSYFGGKAKVRGGRVQMIAAAAGEVLATAVTDEQGDACFAKPAARVLLFRVESSGGHQGEFRLSLAEQGAEPVAAESAAAHPAENAPAVASAPCAGGLTPHDLNQALAPVHQKLAAMESRQNSRVSLGEIIGGLGWIIGLAGAALWAASRRKR